MDNKTLKIEFGNLAVVNNFIYAFGGWYMQFDECIQILELQKSRFGNYYILNIKIMIQDLFGQKYQINKELINRSCGHIDSNETAEFSKFLDLDNQISDDERLLGLKNLFFSTYNAVYKKNAN